MIDIQKFMEYMLEKEYFNKTSFPREKEAAKLFEGFKVTDITSIKVEAKEECEHEWSPVSNKLHYTCSKCGEVAE